MDQTHIHLISNHIPVIGSIFGLFVLFYGIITTSDHTKNAAYFIFVLCAVGAVITYFTGEAAEETVEKIAGISKEMVESHEDSGKLALISMLVLGTASIAALLLNFKRSAFSKTFSYIIILLAFASFAVTAYSANLGGKIRHTEIQDNTTTPIKNNSSPQEDD